MADILPFKRPHLSQKHKGKTLCKSGLHKWEIVQKKQFDVRQGKLITVSRCTRCGTTKSEAC